MNIKTFFYVLFIFHVLMGKEFVPFVNSFAPNNVSRNLTHLVGIMVDFDDEDDTNTLFVEDNPQTSGNGKFLQTLDVNYINYQNKQRCDDQLEFLIDKPPHHHEYFHLQLQAVQNYYNAIYTSNSSNVFEIDMICNDLDGSNSCDNNDEYYHLSEKMEYYTPTDDKIGLLFSDALELAKNDIEDYVSLNNLDYENILFVVFHAGLGQEASQEFDPTPYDIKSAYVDNNMLDDIPANAWINTTLYDTNNDFIGGIIMPETLNWIYYDVIEDIFPIDLVPYNDLDNFYCEIQLGMTGLFSYLIGYHFGYQPMHNTDNGDTRVGLFGLMDVGFYNMNGIIPSRPVPWTRSKRGLSSNIIDITENALTSSYNQSISRVTSSTDQIYKVNISDYEYFLLEHRSNKLNIVGTDKSIREIIDEYYPGSVNYDENNDDYKNIFDVINSNDLSISSNFSYDPIYHVITSVDNYDYGIPGEGLLIWHIDELNYNSSSLSPQGINNDIDNKTVALEEGDGVSNIGNPNYLWFNDNTSGWLYDFWTDDNELYLDVNYGINNWGANSDVFFNSNSIPNSNTNNNSNSSLSILVNNSSTSYSNMTISFDNNIIDEMIFIDDNVNVIGNDGTSCFFYNKDNVIYKYCQGSQPVIYDCLNESNCIPSTNIDANTRILFDGQNYELVDKNDYLQGGSGYQIPQGYFDDIIVLDDSNIGSDILALGDFDQDGYDEKVKINNGNLELYNYSSNNDVLANGFPVYGNFHGNPLISDILNSDGVPEIIIKNENKISFISNNGEILHEIPLFSLDSDLFILPFWTQGKAALLNGDIIFVFDNYNDNYSYWKNPFSTPAFTSVVTGQHSGSSNNATSGIDLSRTYNYPNPVNDKTKFRYFVNIAQSVNIKIYDVAGFLVAELNDNNLIQNEYNEIVWNVRSVESGLYFATIKSDKGESKLIKVVIL